MSGPARTRPAPRPPAKPEISVQEIRTLLATVPGPLQPYQSARVIYAFAWTVNRPLNAGFAVVDVEATLARAHTLARKHPGAVVAFRSLKLRVVEDDF